MPELTEEQRSQLDNNIKQMIAKGASQDDVMAYAKDFNTRFKNPFANTIQDQFKQATTVTKQPEISVSETVVEQPKQSSKDLMAQYQNPVSNIRRGDIVGMPNIPQGSVNDTSGESTLMMNQNVAKRNEAIGNTILRNAELGGVKLNKNSPEYKKEFDSKLKGVMDGNLAVVPAKDGKHFVTRTSGFFETAGHAFINSLKAPVDAWNINTRTGKDLANYIEQQQAEEPYYPKSVPSQVAGAFGEAAGGFPKIAGEMAIPVVGEGIAVAEAQFVAEAEHTKQLYFRNKQELLQQGYSEDEAKVMAAEKARKDAPMQAAPDAAMMFVMGRMGAKSNETATAAKSFVNTLKESAKSVGVVSSLGGASEGARALIQLGQGYDVKASEVMDKASEAQFQYATLDAMFKVMPLMKSMPSALKAAYKNYFSTLPKEIVAEQAAKMGEQEGQQFMQELNQFEAAKEKVNGLVPEEKIPHVAGLIEKQDNVKQEVAELETRKLATPEALHETIDGLIEDKQKQLSSIDKQVKEVIKSDNPISKEVDNATGLKLGEVPEIEKPKESKVTVIMPENKELPKEVEQTNVVEEKPNIEQKVKVSDTREGDSSAIVGEQKNEIIPNEPTPNTEQVEIKKLEQERDIEIDKAVKPDFKMEFIDNTDIALTKQTGKERIKVTKKGKTITAPETYRDLQNDLRKRRASLEALINCL